MIRAMCLLLAFLLALAGGPLSLCTCGPAGHGLACDAAPPPDAPEAPPTEEGCCCCAPEAPVADAPADAPVFRGACSCPELDLSTSPAEAGAQAPQTPVDAAPWSLAAVGLACADDAVATALEAVGSRDGPPWAPRGQPPLYLQHHALRR